MKGKFLKQFCMSVLFFGALYMTVSTISNITFTDMKAALSENLDTSIVEASHHQEKDTSLEEKTLNESIVDQRYISSAETEEAKTIEEAIDFTEYPSVKVLATGYTAGAESTGKSSDHPEYGITYSGLQVKRDLYSTIAADLDVYPIGTIMYIPDYGYGVVADKGAAITGNKIDLYYETVDDVFTEWGKKEVEVYVIEMGDGELTEEQLVQLNEDEALQVFRDQYTKE